MIKVAAYLRLSDEDRIKIKGDDSESIKNQRDIIQAYVDEHEWSIYDYYVDDNWSGGNTNRPDFQRMIQDAQENKFNVVLCKTQTRFSRNLRDIEYYLHEKFIEWGIRFISILDHADTSDIKNLKNRQMNGMTSEWFLLDTSEAVKATFANKRASGQYIGAYALYGYQKDPKDKNHLVIDDNVSDVIQLIYDLYEKRKWFW